MFQNVVKSCIIHPSYPQFPKLVGISLGLIAAPHPRFPVQNFALQTKRTAAVEEEEQHQQEDEHLLWVNAKEFVSWLPKSQFVKKKKKKEEEARSQSMVA